MFVVIKVGAIVEVKCSDKKELIKATIQKIQDCSQYTVGMLVILFLFCFLCLVIYIFL